MGYLTSLTATAPTVIITHMFMTLTKRMMYNLRKAMYELAPTSSCASFPPLLASALSTTRNYLPRCLRLYHGTSQEFLSCCPIWHPCLSSVPPPLFQIRFLTLHVMGTLYAMLSSIPSLSMRIYP